MHTVCKTKLYMGRENEQIIILSVPCLMHHANLIFDLPKAVFGLKCSAESFVFLLEQLPKNSYVCLYTISHKLRFDLSHSNSMSIRISLYKVNLLSTMICAAKF